MRQQVERATVMTSDTRITASDWTDVRCDVLIVPHGAKGWASAPDFSVPRTTLYYVGSRRSGLGPRTPEEIGRASNATVSMVGDFSDESLGPGLRSAGWVPGGDLPSRLAAMRSRVSCRTGATIGVRACFPRRCTTTCYPAPPSSRPDSRHWMISSGCGRSTQCRVRWMRWKRASRCRVGSESRFGSTLWRARGSIGSNPCDRLFVKLGSLGYDAGIEY